MERRAIRAIGNDDPYVLPTVPNPKILGVEITPDSPDKGLLQAGVQDAAQLAHGFLPGLAKLGQGLAGTALLPVTVPLGLATGGRIPIDPFGTKEIGKELGLGLVETGRKLVGATGVSDILGFEGEQKRALDFYRAHPGFFLLDASTIASFGTGTALKSALGDVVKGGIRTTIEVGVIEKVPETTIRAALFTNRGILTKGIRGAIGVSTKKVFNPLVRAIEKAAQTGEVADVVTVVRQSLMKQGVSANSAIKIAQSTATNIAESVARQASKLKVLNAVKYPLRFALKSLKSPVRAITTKLLGTPELMAVGKVYGNVIKPDIASAVKMEEWAQGVLGQKGIVDTVDNRMREIMDWKTSTDFAGKTMQQAFDDFKKYVVEDKIRASGDRLSGVKTVLRKVLDKSTTDAMVENIRGVFDDIKSEVEVTFSKLTPEQKSLRIFDEIEKFMNEHSGYDFGKYAEKIRMAFNKNPSLATIEKEINKLSSKLPSLNYAKISPKAVEIYKKLEGSGWRADVAPLRKNLIQVSDIVEGGVKNVPSITSKGFTGIVNHIRKNGGITMDWEGKVVTKGFTSSILEKADEIRIKIAGPSSRKNFIKTFNSLKEKYGSKQGVRFGVWVDMGDFVVDVVKVGEDMLQSIYDGIIRKQDAIGDLGKYAENKDGTIFITKEIVAGLQPISRRGLRESSSLFEDWAEVISYYGEKNFKNSIDYGKLIKGGVGYVNDAKSVIRAVDFETSRTRLGKALDWLGFSSRGVLSGTREFLFQNSFTQNAIKQLGEKYGAVIRIVRPTVRTTTKGIIAGKSRIAIPVDKLYEWLNNHRKEFSKGIILKKNVVFDIKREDLIKYGFSKELANDIGSILDQSQRSVPASVIGAGEVILSYLRSANPGFLRFGEHFDKFFRTANYMRYESPLSFAFQAQAFLETGINASMLIKNPMLISGVTPFVKGVAGVFGLGERITPGKLGQIFGETKTMLRKITEKPTSVERVIMRDFSSGATKIEDVNMTPEYAFQQKLLSGGERVKRIETAQDISLSRKSNAFWLNSWRDLFGDKLTNAGKGIAEKFGMTLEEAGAYSEKMVGDKLVKVYKNPEVAQAIKDAAETLLTYKMGFQTSPLIRTLNLVWFPMRFQVKSMDLLSKWVGSLSPIGRVVVMSEWSHFANWAGTEEGMKWRRTHQDLLYNILAYTTAYEQIGNTVDAVARGQLFGGNTGLIGGVPFGWIYNLAQELAFIKQDPQTLDPKTGIPFAFRKTPRKLVSYATFVTSLEELLATFMPGMPLYTLSGGILKGVSWASLLKRTLDQGLGGFGVATGLLPGEDVTKGSTQLEREYERISLTEKRF